MTLKEAYKPYFKIGAAVSKKDMESDTAKKLILEEFSTFTAENEMKPMFFLDWEKNRTHPELYDKEPAIQFEFSRKYLDFAKEKGLPLRGHTLTWHFQTPKWFFYQNYNEEAELADKETMLKRQESYIRQVLTFIKEEYPGVIYAWDVVNEVVDEGDFRKSLWYNICGFDFIENAFVTARKYSEPGVALFYNDYESAEPWKRDFIIANVLKPLMEKGLVDGMGMQCHLTMDHPDLDNFKTALKMYGELGLEVQCTELDIHNNDPGEASQKALADRYEKVFQILVDTKKRNLANITAVTFWCLIDEESWLTGFRKETSYPLLFWKDFEKKPAYYSVLNTGDNPK